MQHEDDFICIGDWVEHLANANVFGIVIAHEGSLLHVRLSPSLGVVKFHEYELRKLGGEEQPPAKEEDSADVINFTEAVADLKKAKTRGNA